MITPAHSTQRGGARISSSSSITYTLDGTVESWISSLESAAEQTNQMMQDMMKMMKKFAKSQGINTSSGQQQSMEVTTTMEQYNFNASHGEEPK
jgi:uncharacterized phage infection (PIP) family protein YhgE